MQMIHDGQCGLCAHFAEHHASPQEQQVLIQIRVSKTAPETLLEECGHPKHADLHLKVTPTSGCDGFTPARPN